MIAAIIELTAAQGYEATQVADIVRAAHVARKTLYDNFDGKEDLFLAAFDHSIAELTDAVHGACEAADGGWEERIEAGLGAFLGFVAEHPATARVCMVEALAATPTASARHDAAQLRFVELLKESAPRGTGLPETLEESLVGGVTWIVSRLIRRGQAERAAELLPELSEFVLGPYRGAAAGEPA